MSRVIVHLNGALKRTVVVIVVVVAVVVVVVVVVFDMDLSFHNLRRIQ